MILNPDDAERFFKLHKALTLFVNQRLKVAKAPARSKGIIALPPEQRLRVRDALVEHLDLIDAFVAENPYKLVAEELAVVASWKDLVAGDFYVLKFLKMYTVFLTAKEPTVAYGVLGLSDPLEEVIDQPLPFYCKTVLLPFGDRIVYDGLLSGYGVIIGSNITRELNDAYNDAKKRQGVVTSLPWQPVPTKAAPKRKTARKKKGKKGSDLVGRWRIVWMDGWDQDFVDAEVEGYFEFERDGGEFQFGYVHGDIDYREVERGGKPGVEFTWDGNDEMDRAQGRGWAVLDGEEIEGRIFFHRGDESAFRAVRKGE